MFKKYPQYQKNPLFLAGESYAGTTLPLLAAKILNGNHTANIKIRLSGLILISPWADPVHQVTMDTQFAFSHGIINAAQTKQMDQLVKQYVTFIQQKKYLPANDTCNHIDNSIIQYSGLWLANIDHSANDDTTLLEQYLNNSKVLKAIHATKIGSYHVWSDQANKSYLPYIQLSMRKLYNQLLSKHIPLLILSGLSDAKDTNFLGVNNFIQHLSWPNKSAYLFASTHIININKNVLGYEKSGGYLTRATILHAGHMIPQDQPNIDQVVKAFVSSPPKHHNARHAG